MVTGVTQTTPRGEQDCAQGDHAAKLSYVSLVGLEHYAVSTCPWLWPSLTEKSLTLHP